MWPFGSPNGNHRNLVRLPFLANSGMDFDDLVKTAVPAGLVKDVSDILVASGFTSALASQAWELRVVLWLRMGLRPLASVGRRRRRRFGLVWFCLADPQTTQRPDNDFLLEVSFL